MSDPTEAIRRKQKTKIDKMTPEQIPEKQWTTAELQEEFTDLRFAAPYVMVHCKMTGEEGTLMFKHSPRVYFGYQKK